MWLIHKSLLPSKSCKTVHHSASRVCVCVRACVRACMCLTVRYLLEVNPENMTQVATQVAVKTDKLSSIALWSSPSKDEVHLPRSYESGSSYFAHENMAATKSTHPDGRSCSHQLPDRVNVIRNGKKHFIRERRTLSLVSCNLRSLVEDQRIARICRSRAASTSNGCELQA